MDQDLSVKALKKNINSSVSRSFWFWSLGVGCCGDEVLQTTGPKYDLERFGCIQASSPDQADLLIINTAVTSQLTAEIKTIYHRMLKPKYVMAVGSCACSGALFKTVPLGDVIPVDVYVPGCPPRPEAIMHGLVSLQRA